jgi:ribonuclease E
MPPRGTRLLFFGDASEVARFGGDPDDGPPGLTKEELPALPTPFVFEAGAPAPASARSAAPIAPVRVDPDDDALFTAALEGDFVPIAAEGDAASPDAAVASAETDSEAAARKKRRRRRRGRGRRGDQLEGAELEAGIAGEGELLGEDDEDADEEEIEDQLSGTLDPEDTEPHEAVPGVMIFDVATETFAVSVPPGPAPRSRPSLEELLPQSDLPDGGELPPIPDELLPLPDRGLGLTGVGEADTEGDLDSSPEAARRARRSRGGVGRFRRGRQNEDAVPASGEAVAETGEEPIETPAAENTEITGNTAEAPLNSALIDETLDDD